MSATNERIERLVRKAAEANRSAILAPRNIDHHVRGYLEELATACGATYASAQSASERDLIALYDTARKAPQSAIAVARTLGRKYSGASPVASDPAPSVQMQEVNATTIERALGYLPPSLTEVLSELGERFKAQGREAVLAHNTRLDKFVGCFEEALPGMVASALKALTPTTLVIQKPNSAPEPTGAVHFQTPRILRALNARLNVYLNGPAGSGKTTSAQVCAKALGVPLYCTAKVESEYLLLGFRDARGETVRTQFREAYEHGGLFLFDELDGSSPSAIVALNRALANKVCAFPDGNVPMHADFYCLAAGNTALTGATRAYQGRSALDGASIDRFYFIDFPYDEVLERSLATNAGWCMHVQAIRAAVRERGLEVIISPRATFDGCKALEAGETWEDVERATCFKGLDDATVQQLKGALINPLISNRSAA